MLAGWWWWFLVVCLVGTPPVAFESFCILSLFRLLSLSHELNKALRLRSSGKNVEAKRLEQTRGPFAEYYFDGF